jgi:hypothetical protein
MMIAMYCVDHHGSSGGLCPRCEQLESYAEKRIRYCVYGPDKPVCSVCPLHCYRPGMREQIRQVMRYAGPRMLRRHPVAAVRHLLRKLRPAPPRPDPKSNLG